MSSVVGPVVRVLRWVAVTASWALPAAEMAKDLDQPKAFVNGADSCGVGLAGRGVGDGDRGRGGHAWLLGG